MTDVDPRQRADRRIVFQRVGACWSNCRQTVWRGPELLGEAAPLPCVRRLFGGLRLLSCALAKSVSRYVWDLTFVAGQCPRGLWPEITVSDLVRLSLDRNQEGLDDVSGAAEGAALLN